jgi:hypothetical protein
MTPVVLIATHQRLAITSANIRTLQAQSLRPVIVIVCTDPLEAEHYRDYEGVHVVEVANEPLGAKWQAGVDFARQLNPPHLIITGSDDILCANFVERFTTHADGVKFTGLQKWYVWSPATNTLYLFDYLARQCLGGGRVYTEALLDAYDWQLFATGKGKLLDDQGWDITNPGTRRVITEEGCILAVKGNWPVMNSLAVTLEHKNAKLVRQWKGGEALEILETKFNYKQ